MLLHTKQAHAAATVCTAATHRKWHEFGLNIRFLGHDLAEHMVHPAHHRLGGAKVGDEIFDVDAERFTSPEVGADVSAPKAVNGLLRVADHKESACQRFWQLVGGN